MNMIWVSANRLGYALLQEAVKVRGVKLRAIITLTADSNIIMYDGVKKEKWKNFSTNVLETNDINKVARFIKKVHPDLMVVCGWRQILNQKIIRIPKKGTVGFHPTLLPYGRGPAPIINTLLEGSEKTGLTMFYMDKNIDSGDIIAQQVIKLKKTDHAGDVYRKIITSGKTLVRKYLPLIIQGLAPRIVQDLSKATVFIKPKLGNNRIDLDKEPLDEIFRKIKALSYPYKGACIEKDRKRLIIWNAELQDVPI